MITPVFFSEVKGKQVLPAPLPTPITLRLLFPFPILERRVYYFYLIIGWAKMDLLKYSYKVKL